MAEEPDQPQRQAQIIMSPDQMGGVWANFARVHHSEHEFTLDFVRLDYGTDPVMGTVVARVSVSPLFITQLIDALNNNWAEFAKKALPQEVNEHGDNDDVTG
ncbi:MAG: DUF3467 domain-containing protein [Actinomycetota bacterium]|nr:DUF3467 domain-containing protein [Actinomycetota bacterium]